MQVNVNITESNKSSSIGLFGLIFGIIRIIVGVIFIISIYLLPTGVAMLRHRLNTLSIFLLNLLLGWALIPWVIALCWAFSNDEIDVLKKLKK